MTTFCTKCGASLTPENEFCPMCGAPTKAAAGEIQPPIPPASYAPPAFTPVQTPSQTAWQAPPPYAQQSMPVQPTSGGGVIKVILIIVAVVVGIGIVGAGIFGYTVYRISRAVHVENSGDKVTVHTSGGTISTDASQAMTASDLGIDPYPGAQAGHGSMKMELPTGSMHTGIFLTNDPKEKVIEFYKSKLGSAASAIETGSGAMITLTKDHDETIMVTITGNTTDHEGKTQISIVHTKSNKSS